MCKADVHGFVSPKGVHKFRKGANDTAFDNHRRGSPSGWYILEETNKVYLCHQKVKIKCN